MRKSDLALSFLKSNFHYLMLFLLFFPGTLLAGSVNTYPDQPFQQPFSIRYLYTRESGKLRKVVSDRNGYVQALSESGLLRPRNGQFLFPGTLVPDLQDKPLSDKKVKDLMIYQNQLVYLTNQAVLSNARGGILYIPHDMPDATLSNLSNGDVTSGSTEDSDNDGLWTSMYLASQAFRYAVTYSEDALQNVRESLDAMERLYTVNGLNSGFPSRSFMRRGYKYDDPAWRRAPDPEWDWKSTTSSDEAIGHIFAFGVIAELVKDSEINKKAVLLIDTLMSHILRNDFYLVDWDGKPTRWGRWNTEYVNAFPVMVGDRKLNSSNITGMLQTAWHFTGKEKYRQAAHHLLDRMGYLENLMRPMGVIGKAPEGSDEQSEMLSDGWNHSDDEMYFLGYWGLYRYALNDSLKAAFGKAILDHWEAERPEKEGLWNIMTALTGTESFDLKEAIRYLQEYPLDLINWTITNSHRKDIDFMPVNFRNQTISEVLPPDELPVSRHNANRFRLDENGEGREEYSAGDIWLLPYWMGRYLGVISEPSK